MVIYLQDSHQELKESLCDVVSKNKTSQFNKYADNKRHCFKHAWKLEQVPTDNANSVDADEYYAVVLINDVGLNKEKKSSLRSTTVVIHILIKLLQ